MTMTQQGPLARHLLATAAAVAGAGLLLGGCAAGADPAATETDAAEDYDPITLTLADFSPETGPNGKAWAIFQDIVEERTDGKVTFENYWAGSLLGATEVLSGVSDGVADLGTVIPSYYPEDLAITTWTMGLGDTVSPSVVHAVAAGGAATYEFMLTQQEVLDEYSEQGLVPLMSTASAPYRLLCTKPVNSLDEAEGLRARGSGPLWVSTLEALGMTSVNVALNEAYESMQRGVIDCVSVQASGYITFGLVEIAKNFVPVTLANLLGTTFVINQDVWNTLPPSVQAIMRDAASEAATAIWDFYLEGEAALGPMLEPYGGDIAVSDTDELDPVVRDEQKAWIDAMVDTAPGGLADPQAVIDSFTEKLERWDAVLTDEGFEPSEGADQYGELDGIDLTSFSDIFTAEVVAKVR